MLVFFYPCNIPRTFPDPLYTSSYFVSICPRSSFASIESMCFSSILAPWRQVLSRIRRDRRKPVRSCVFRKAMLSALWRILPGYRFGRIFYIHPKNPGKISSPASSTCRPVSCRMFLPPRDKLRVLPACRSAFPPPTPQPPPIATSTLCRKLKEQLEDSNRYAQDGSSGRDAETTKEFPAKMPTAGPPPGSPPPPSATTALHHRPSGHSEDEQEATHDSKSDAGRAWTEGNAKIVEHPPQDERAPREEQAGTD